MTNTDYSFLSEALPSPSTMFAGFFPPTPGPEKLSQHENFSSEDTSCLSPNASSAGTGKSNLSFMDEEGFLRPTLPSPGSKQRKHNLKVVTSFEEESSSAPVSAKKKNAAAQGASPASRALSQFLNIPSPKTPSSPVVGLFVDTPRSRHRCGRKFESCKGGCTGHGYGAYHKSPSTSHQPQYQEQTEQENAPAAVTTTAAPGPVSVVAERQAPLKGPSPGIFASPNGSVYKKLWSPSGGARKVLAAAPETLPLEEKRKKDDGLMKKLLVRRVRDSAETDQQEPAKVQKKEHTYSAETAAQKTQPQEQREGLF